MGARHQVCSDPISSPVWSMARPSVLTRSKDVVTQLSLQRFPFLVNAQATIVIIRKKGGRIISMADLLYSFKFAVSVILYRGQTT
jgi:hypothetical protein